MKDERAKGSANGAVILEMLFQGKVSRFILRKIDPQSFRGYRRKVGLDRDGRECATALLTDDGCHLLVNGCTAELYLDERGDVVERKDLTNRDGDGVALPELPSTVGKPQIISGPIRASEMLEQVVTAAYLMEVDVLAPNLEEALEAGEIFRAPFRPRPTPHDHPAFLFKGVDAYFLVITNPCRFEFARPGQTFCFLDDDETEGDNEEADFSVGFPAWSELS